MASAEKWTYCGNDEIGRGDNSPCRVAQQLNWVIGLILPAELLFDYFGRWVCCPHVVRAALFDGCIELGEARVTYLNKFKCNRAVGFVNTDDIWLRRDAFLYGAQVVWKIPRGHERAEDFNFVLTFGVLAMHSEFGG